MDKLKSIKIKYKDGTYSDEIPIGVSAENVDYNDTKTLKQVLDLDVTKGTVEERLNKQSNDISSMSIAVDNANENANVASGKADAVDTRLDNIIIESGTSEAEVVAARTNANTGVTYATLAQRLDTENSEIKEDLSAIQTATTDDVGRALKVKTVTDGQVTEWEFGEAGGSVDTDKTLTESDMPADSGVTGRYIRAILNLLKGATYDQSKIANAEHVIDMLDIEIFGIYTLPAPLVCDADQFIDTGFSVTSTEDYGYANDWYILLDAKIDAVSKIFGNRSWWFERQQSAANNSILVVKAPNFNVEAKIGGQVLGNRFKYAITYDHTRHKITAHGVNNNTLVSVLANYNLPSEWGPLMIGGSTEESFRGTIYQLDVRLGTLTESEIKAYLGVE